MMLKSSTLSLPLSVLISENSYSCAAPGIGDWKTHVLRSDHQDVAKSEINENLKLSQGLLIMDG